MLPILCGISIESALSEDAGNWMLVFLARNRKKVTCATMRVKFCQEYNIRASPLLYFFILGK